MYTSSFDTNKRVKILGLPTLATRIFYTMVKNAQNKNLKQRFDADGAFDDAPTLFKLSSTRFLTSQHLIVGTDSSSTLSVFVATCQCLCSSNTPPSSGSSPMMQRIVSLF